MALKRTKNPGEFYDDITGKVLKIVEWRIDDRYDTVVTASGAVTAGLQKIFFRDMTNKDLIDANFNTPNRVLGTGEEMIVERIGMYLPTVLGNTVATAADLRKSAEGAHISVTINRDPVAVGPVIRFPTGYGIAGQTTENAQTIASVGVPSTAAAAKLARTHDLQPNTDVSAVLTWYDHVWDATNLPNFGQKVYHRLHLHGLIKAAATRGT